MKNFFHRLIRLFSIKSSKFIRKHEDAIEIYEYELKKSKETLERLADSQSKLRADKLLIEDKRRKTEAAIQITHRILDKSAEQNDDVLGEEAMAHLESLERSIEINDSTISYYDEVLVELEDQYETLKAKLSEKATKLDELKAQNEFAKNMESINTELRNHYSEEGLDLTSFEKIEKDLKGKIYFEKDRNKRFTPKPTLQEKVQIEGRKSKFEEYKQKRLAEVKEG